MEEAFRISAIGIFIVFFALFFISFILSLTGRIFIKTAKNKLNSVNEEEYKNNNELSPQIIAVIAASVQVAYGGCTKIKSIGLIHRESQYGKQGRIKIMESHKLK